MLPANLPECASGCGCLEKFNANELLLIVQNIMAREKHQSSALVHL